MTAPSVSAMPTFNEFYRALHDGQQPFPWQTRLAEETLRDGWPDLLDLPTGVGKTSALDIALYTLACAPDRMPRRTVLVVDRRIVVDQAGDHSRRLSAKLHTAREGPLRIVADALRALFGGSGGDRPVEVAVMRGGMPRENDWAARPDVPMIGISTVDQVGSRLLFRGYGLSERSRSIHAGLLGHDALILLDEVHLSVPFAETLRAIRARFRAVQSGVPDRFKVVEMSATPGGASEGTRTFQLDSADRASSVLGKRLGARKLVRTEEVKVTGKEEHPKLERLAHRAVDVARALQENGATVVAVVLNRVESARLAARRAAELLRDKSDVILLTGRMRPIDRDRLVAERIVALCGAGRDRASARPVVVVATQCIEAGADLDFDAMVTECPSLDALRQRVGRVDRRGELGESDVVVLARSDSVAVDADDPVYGGAIATTWQWLSEAVTLDLGVDGFDAIASVLPVPHGALAPRPSAPVLLPMHLDLLSQTSPAPLVDPEVGLWLHGPERASADVQVIWRSDLTLVDASDDVGTRLGVVRPSVLESVSIPIWAARRWLAGEGESAVADVEVGRDAKSEAPRRKDAPSPPVAFRWDGQEAALVTSREIRPGDVLIVPSSSGGLDEWGSFDAMATDPVRDFGDLAQLRAHGLPTLRLSLAGLHASAFSASLIASLPQPADDDSPRQYSDALADWVAGWPEDPPSLYAGRTDEWSALRSGLRAKGRVVTIVGADAVIAGRRRSRTVVVRGGIAEALTESDAGSFTGNTVPLDRHSAQVRDVAGAFAERAGLPPAVVADIRLAAWCHDVGKNDPRFQRWLRGGDAPFMPAHDVALAKGTSSGEFPQARERARVLAGYPRGYRHELLSTAMVAGSSLLNDATDADLVLHLIASHHGWCRPFPPLADDEADSPVETEFGGAALSAGTRHRLARLDSGVSDRFWSLTERYGWWGVAWMEAMVRLADHVVSAREEEAS